MLNSIRRFFDDYLSPDSGSARDPEAAARCATAALLLEMAHMDDVMTPVEHQAIRAAVEGRFGLDPEQVDRLLECAREEREHATDYYQLTSLINAHFDAAQRAELVEQLWRIAYADRVLGKHEEYLVRKVANLLHVPHSAFIAAKHRVVDNGPPSH